MPGLRPAGAPKRSLRVRFAADVEARAAARAIAYAARAAAAAHAAKHAAQQAHPLHGTKTQHPKTQHPTARKEMFVLRI